MDEIDREKKTGREREGRKRERERARKGEKDRQRGRKRGRNRDPCIFERLLVDVDIMCNHKLVVRFGL